MGKPYSTIQSAIDAASPGDIVRIYPSSIPYANFSNTKSDITIEGTIAPTYNEISKLKTGIIINGVCTNAGSNVIIKNLIDSSATDGFLDQGGINNTYENIISVGRFINDNYHGIQLYKSDGSKIKNFKVFKHTHGLAVKAKNVTIDNFYARDNVVDGIIIKSDNGATGTSILTENIKLSNFDIKSSNSDSTLYGIYIEQFNEDSDVKNVIISQGIIVGLKYGMFLYSSAAAKYRVKQVSINGVNIDSCRNNAINLNSVDNINLSAIRATNTLTANGPDFGQGYAFVNNSSTNVVMSGCTFANNANGNTLGVFQ